MTELEQNDNRIWYDRGYSLAKSEARKESAVPILIGSWSLVGMMYFDPMIAIAFLIMYSLFKIQEYEDAKANSERKREMYDPGQKWEWQEENRE